MIKNILTTTIFIASFLTVGAQTYSGPESVEFDYANNRWLIANTTSHQVLARSASGTLTVFASGLGSGPYGIEIMGDTLYCCSGSSIKGFDLTTGASVYTINVGATFLNGITHDNSGNLIATDFSAKKIFKINPSSNSFIQIASNLVQSPNGIIFDAANNRCVFANWGSSAPIKAIDLSNNSVSTIYPSPHSNIDGITRDGNGNYFVSVWGTNKIYKYDSTFSSAGIPYGTGLNSPADIFYNVLNDTLAVPNSGNNTVSFISFATTDVKTLNNEDKILLYPNPSTTQFSISMQHSGKIDSFKVYDIAGNEIHSFQSTFYGDKIIVDFNNDPGIYIIELLFEGSLIRKKLVQL